MDTYKDKILLWLINKLHKLMGKPKLKDTQIQNTKTQKEHGI